MLLLSSFARTRHTAERTRVATVTETITADHTKALHFLVVSFFETTYATYTQTGP